MKNLKATRLRLGEIGLFSVAVLGLALGVSQASAQNIDDIVNRAAKIADGVGADNGLGPTGVGDFVLDPKESVKCKTTQTCNIKCPKGKCTADCSGSSTCTVDCPEGGCKLYCAGTATCKMTCPKGGCKMTGGGSSNSSVDCPKGNCTGSCAGTSTCNLGCPELVKKRKTCSLGCGRTTTCACTGDGCKRRKKR